uniref:FBA_2 domain-containing protein n=1 Tax=Caenorhabditis tropicalis TaxID=1561998 RepID=A0A1I7TQY0_9PELO
MITYWAEPIIGTMKLIEYFCDLFNVEVDDMTIHWDSGDLLMKWVQQRQKRLYTVRFSSNQCEKNQFTPETIKSFIMDCEAKDIRFDAYTTQPLQIQNFQKRYDRFCVSIGTWFTLEHLMTLDCIDISITGKRFTSTEMNEFFKHWMSGGSPRLSFLKVKLVDYNEQELMEGIDVKWNMKTVLAPFLTSLCSRRSFSTIKTLRRKSNDIRITAGSECLVIAQCDERLVSFQFGEIPTRNEMVTINGKLVPFDYDKRQKVNSFWAERIFGTMELVEHVTSLFGIQVDTVVIEKDSGTRLMNWVQKRQKSLRMVEVNSYNSMEYQFESEDLKNIIMECEADYIQLRALHSSPFEIQNLTKKFEVFECLRGTWITVDNLMTLDCVRITVEEKRFTCAELNRFIKHWLQGGSHRLKTLRVVLADINEQDLFDGLDARWNFEKVVVLRYLLNAFNGFFEVVRSDGITAGFQAINGYFWFGVWPSDSENVLYLDSF